MQFFLLTIISIYAAQVVFQVGLYYYKRTVFIQPFFISTKPLHYVQWALHYYSNIRNKVFIIRPTIITSLPTTTQEKKHDLHTCDKNLYMQRSQDHEDETPDAFNSARVVSIRVGTFMNCVSFMSLAYTVNKHELNGKPTYRKTLESGNSFCSLKELSGSCISSNTRFEVVTIVSTRIFTLITNNRGPLEHGALKIWYFFFIDSSIRTILKKSKH